jgi:predicted small secreted protein
VRAGAFEIGLRFEGYAMLKKLLLVITLVILTIVLTSCNTVQGLGKDIEWTGQKGAEVLSGQ